MDKSRCSWANKDQQYKDYHDNEWGKPVFDDKILFEFLILESFQAGLSWHTILKKREGFKEAFFNFDVIKVSNLTEQNILKLLDNEKIIRHRGKIEATKNNAKIFIEIQKEYGSFSNYLWAFTNKKPIINQWSTLSEVPAKTELSDIIAKDLKKRGIKFFGSTTAYAYLQAIGVVNDHLVSCFCYNK